MSSGNGSPPTKRTECTPNSLLLNYHWQRQQFNDISAHVVRDEHRFLASSASARALPQAAHTPAPQRLLVEALLRNKATERAFMPVPLAGIPFLRGDTSDVSPDYQAIRGFQ